MPNALEVGAEITNVQLGSNGCYPDTGETNRIDADPSVSAVYVRRKGLPSFT